MRTVGSAPPRVLSKAFSTALLIAIMLLQATLLVALSQKEEMHANIFGYMHREPWMKPGGTARIPMMDEAETLNPSTFTIRMEH
ncbi:MAG: hypothetical protein ABWW70_00620 [Thermoproteota archaeon]